MGTLRIWATPLTMGAFGLLAVTGVLMFFHLDTGLNKEAHEWLGWALVIGGVLHGVTNFAAVKRHLLRWQGAVVVAVFAVLLGLSFLSLGEEGSGGSPVKVVVGRLTEVPLEALAPLAGVEVEELVARVRAQGYGQAEEGQSLQAITGERGKAVQVLAKVVSEAR